VHAVSFKEMLNKRFDSKEVGEASHGGMIRNSSFSVSKENGVSKNQITV